MNIINMEMIQATIEFFGGFICLMIATIIVMNGHARKSWKLLKWMFLSTAVIFISEACAYIFRGNTDEISVFVTRLCNFTVFLFNIVLIHFFIQYLYNLMNEKGVEAGRIYVNIVRGCLVVDLIILATNVFSGWMYYFDKSNYYHRNTGWYVYTIINLVCILACSAMCMRYRRAVRKSTLLATLLYIFTPLIAIVLQTFFYGISITNIGVFIALIIMLMAYLKEWSNAKEIKETERKSLEIIVLFFIMTINMSASIISCLVSIDRISNKNSQSNSILIAHMINSGIENEFIKPIMVAETMCNDYSLKEYMKQSNKISSKMVEEEVASYLDSIRDGFGYQMVFAVCDGTKAYYTYDGISKYVDTENDSHDIWYKKFCEAGSHYLLDVDTDEANDMELAVFVNTEIKDDEGNFLGVCGVGVDMASLQKLLKQYEDTYDVKINLVNEQGLIQVDTDTGRIEKDYVDNSYFKNIGQNKLYIQEKSDSRCMTKYNKTLKWYLVIEDCNPNKINVVELTIPSIIIFVIGLMMMGIVFFIISERERKISKELSEKKKLSITDDLTGLFNRRAFEEACNKVQRTNTLARKTLIMMDVNGLKAANDNFGHIAGDELLIGAAKCIRTTMGEYGDVYRIGGDEFMALLECTESQLEDTIETFEHITASWKGSYQCELAVSKGIVVAKEHEDMDIEQLKELADKLMYEDKDEYYRRTGKIHRRI